MNQTPQPSAAPETAAPPAPRGRPSWRAFWLMNAIVWGILLVMLGLLRLWLGLPLAVDSFMLILGVAFTLVSIFDRIHRAVATGDRVGEGER